MVELCRQGREGGCGHDLSLPRNRDRDRFAEAVGRRVQVVAASSPCPRPGMPKSESAPLRRRRTEGWIPAPALEQIGRGVRFPSGETPHEGMLHRRDPRGGDEPACAVEDVPEGKRMPDDQYV